MTEVAAANEGVLEWSDESSDESWSPSSMEDDDSLDDENVDWNKWRETPFLAKQVVITMDSVEPETIDRYLEETTQIKTRLKSEVNSIRTMHNTCASPQIAEDANLTDNEILNCFFSPIIAFELHGVMNKGLSIMGKPPMNEREFENVIRLIFYFSYYGKGPAEICSHPENFPEPAELISQLQGDTDKKRKDRLLDLLRSFEGDGGVNREDLSLTWTSPYDIDKSLENLFFMIGRQASKLCFVQGRTNLIIDDDKLKLRSALAAAIGLVRSKGLKSFGPVANCINSLCTGIILSSYMSHHGESALDITEANLMCILGTHSTSTLSFPDTGLGGDRGYNDEELQECLVEYLLEILNTVRRGPSLAVISLICGSVD